MQTKKLEKALKGQKIKRGMKTIHTSFFVEFGLVCKPKSNLMGVLVIFGFNNFGVVGSLWVVWSLWTLSGRSALSIPFCTFGLWSWRGISRIWQGTIEGSRILIFSFLTSSFSCLISNSGQFDVTSELSSSSCPTLGKKHETSHCSGY